MEAKRTRTQKSKMPPPPFFFLLVFDDAVLLLLELCMICDLGYACCAGTIASLSAARGGLGIFQILEF